MRADRPVDRQARVRFRNLAGRGRFRPDDRRHEIARRPRDRGHDFILRTRNGRFDLHWVDPFGGETEEQVGEDKIVAPLAGHRGGACWPRRAHDWKRGARS
jgi:hypothetical protein